MASSGKKITELTPVTSAAGTSLLYIVVDPSGTPLSKSITVANLWGNVSTNAVISTSARFTIQGNMVLAPKTRPGSPAEGQIYYDSDVKHFFGYNGTEWKQLDN